MREITQEQFDKATALFDEMQEVRAQIKSARTLAEKVALIRRREALAKERLEVLYGNI
ncbi:MAG TPA: hypothetical protein VF748_15145 [Candidatus Acidoferrum sp.]